MRPRALSIPGLLSRRHPPALLVLNGAPASQAREALRWARRLGPRPFVVAVDGGWRVCRRAGIRPRLFVGDADSAPRPDWGVACAFYPRDKNFSDLAAALALVHGRGHQAVVVAGLTGGRLDHEWANLLELAAFAPRFRAIVAPTARGLVLLTPRGCDLRLPPGRLFSLFAPGASATLSLRGARWALERRRLAPGSRGLSNEARGTVRLRVARGVALLVCPRL